MTVSRSTLYSHSSNSKDKQCQLQYLSMRYGNTNISNLIFNGRLKVIIQDRRNIPHFFQVWKYIMFFKFCLKMALELVNYISKRNWKNIAPPPHWTEIYFYILYRNVFKTLNLPIHNHIEKYLLNRCLQVT